MVKNLLAMWETWVPCQDQTDPLEKGMDTPLQYSWVFPGGSDKRARFDPWVEKIPWRRE